MECDRELCSGSTVCGITCPACSNVILNTGIAIWPYFGHWPFCHESHPEFAAMPTAQDFTSLSMPRSPARSRSNQRISPRILAPFWTKRPMPAAVCFSSYPAPEMRRSRSLRFPCIQQIVVIAARLGNPREAYRPLRIAQSKSPPWCSRAQGNICFRTFGLERFKSMKTYDTILGC